MNGARASAGKDCPARRRMQSHKHNDQQPTQRFAPVRIPQHEERYPCTLPRYLAGRAPTALTVRGNVDLLSRLTSLGLVALFCSVECPPPLIGQTYDLARALRDVGVPVISGFHSPMEKECLLVLLQGSQPVIMCLARSIEQMRLVKDWQPALQQGRLLLLSPFVGSPRRVTLARAGFRNECIAALADLLLIAHAAPGGQLERLCHITRSWGKPLLALAHEANAGLLALGAKPIGPDQVRTGAALLNLLSQMYMSAERTA